MYIAELKGKLPSDTRKSEDVLTSNVFSFFNYSKRTFYLKALMEKLNINVSDKDLNEAEFIFWPTYKDNTEPDVVLIIGRHYVLFEAKYFSDFGKETPTAETQLIREEREGNEEACNLGKKFILVAVTADYCFKPEKFETIPDYKKKYKWFNWQTVTELLLRLNEIESNLPNKRFATDLLRLLEFKELRPFNELIYNEVDKVSDNIFLNPKTIIHRGKFIGFQKMLDSAPNISYGSENIFFKKEA